MQHFYLIISPEPLKETEQHKEKKAITRAINSYANKNNAYANALNNNKVSIQNNPSRLDRSSSIQPARKTLLTWRNYLLQLNSKSICIVFYTKLYKQKRFSN